MAENSKIEWTDNTFNPWIGCQKVSPGCDRCYAETLSNRYGWVKWGPHGERRRTSEANWRKPLKWAKAARLDAAQYIGPRPRPRVFCASLADVFDNRVPDAWRSDLFALIEDTPDLDWLLLTKRPENIAKMLWPKWDGGLPRNIWLGTTAEDQEHFDRRWGVLAKIPAAVRFVSYEPALGPLALTPAALQHDHPVRMFPDWIICGGESGHGARHMQPYWAYQLRAECDRLNVPFFMKQMTGKKPIPDDLLVRQFPKAA